MSLPQAYLHREVDAGRMRALYGSHDFTRFGSTEVHKKIIALAKATTQLVKEGGRPKTLPGFSLVNKC